MGLLNQGRKRNLSGTKIGEVLNILMVIFIIYCIYALMWGFPYQIVYRSVFLAVLIALAMMFYTFDNKGELNKITIFDYVLAILSLLVGVYILLNADRYINRIVFADKVFISDIIFGIIAILLVLEATRRLLGLPLLSVALVFILYLFFGKYIPGMFRITSRLEFSGIIEHFFMSTSGIYTMPVGVMSSYVVMLMMFGEFLTVIGCGQFFIDIAQSITGGRRGGCAQTAVVSSCFFGMISGSTISNVATTGAFTIPMMKSAGYPAHFAAAVETSASCGGSIMPPIMGAVAFIMAEVIGVPYYKIAIAAIFPALLYYAAIFYGVDAEAVKRNLKGLSKSEIPALRKTISNGIIYLVPLIWLVYRIFQGISPTKSAFESVLSMLVIGLIKRNKKYPLTISLIFRALAKTVRSLIPITSACATAGIIIGVINLTGMGGKFSAILLRLSGGYLPISLILTMIVAIILGMGMNITPVYILTASLAGPALIKAGLLPMAVHLFILYYAAMATMTPPVCLSAYTAAAIAECNPMKAGYTAVKLAFVAFIIPFAFIFNNAIILQNSSIMEIIYSLVMVTAALYALASGMYGRVYRKNKLWETAVLIIAGVLMFFPSYTLNPVGMILLIVIIIVQLSTINKMAIVKEGTII